MNKVKTDATTINDLLTRGIADTVVRASLEKKLASGKPLRIKFGIDPTNEKIHIGHAIPLLKLRDFIEAGHQAVLLFGSFTSRFGDPSDKDETRTMLTKEHVDAMAKGYLEKISAFMPMGKIEVRYNHEWYDTWSFTDGLKLMSKFTVARMLERDMFARRMKNGKDIRFHEPVYPMLQGYDSVALEADIALAGNDQLFNELQARPLQEDAGQTPQDVMTMQLILGTDGKQKMSKSLDNSIPLSTSATEKYAMVMSIADTVMPAYFELLTRVPMDEVKNILANEHPRDAKMRLAREIVEIFHDKDAVQDAEAHFVAQFQKKEIPDDVPIITDWQTFPDTIALLVHIGAAKSNGEARRLVEQGGVKVNDVVVVDGTKKLELASGAILRVGKKRMWKMQ